MRYVWVSTLSVFLYLIVGPVQATQGQVYGPFKVEGSQVMQKWTPNLGQSIVRSKS